MSPLIRLPTGVFAIALCVFPATARPARFSRHDGFVTIQGHQLIAPDGKVLRLKGINLGGWLLPEGYMFGFSKATAPWQIQQTFKELVGTEANNDFWRRWYHSFITRDDIRYIRSTGMNVVRIPFDYRLFTPEEYPGPGWGLALSSSTGSSSGALKWACMCCSTCTLHLAGKPGPTRIIHMVIRNYLMISPAERAPQRSGDAWRFIMLKIAM